MNATELAMSAIETPEDSKCYPVLTRYPSTYARDFARQHAERMNALDENFPMDFDFSNRAEAGDAIKRYAAATGQDAHEVLVALADAYLAEHADIYLPMTAEDKSERLAEWAQIRL